MRVSGHLFPIAIALLLFTNGLAQVDTVQKVMPGRTNSKAQQKKPYVIMISADGFRFDYAKKYNAVNLLRLSAGGVAAEYMTSSYPSLTFPNHYSLVTGMYPSHNGLVDNTFYSAGKQLVYNMNDRKKVGDSSWYGGVPIWVGAEKQNMISASFYWVGTEAAIGNVRPTYYYKFSELISTERRLQILKDWLTLPVEKRPHLITFYFSEADHQGHNFGPDAPETEKAVHHIDESVGKMSAMAEALGLPVNFIFVSDHGMTRADIEHPLTVPEVLRDSMVCKLTFASALLHVYCRDKSKINSLYEQLSKGAVDYEVYLPKNTPPAWHYTKTDDLFDRIGDILLVSKFPKIFVQGNSKPTPGKHGFDPAINDMHATFYAWGPAFKKGLVIPPFENVNIYPLIAEILKIEYHQPIDGKLGVLKPILKP